jgi:hypothetical protein
MVKADQTPARMATRQKLILAGLYLSKYDSLGVRKLGFDSFIEAFNVIGYALGSRPASIKNYRDEFDPLFSNNPRKGWHRRPTREYCRVVFEEYKDLDFESFTGLVESFFGFDESVWSAAPPADEREQGISSFAQRLITGLAAEQYFEGVYGDLAEFSGCLVENTTRFGCGYDFRVRSEQGKSDFLAVEVKGLREQTGNLSMTPKEYDVASTLTDRFFLFVVKNFREVPTHQIFKNPLSSNLRFRKVERVVVQVSWLTTV